MAQNKFAIRKYDGDDKQSWAVFRKDALKGIPRGSIVMFGKPFPLWAGLTRQEAASYKAREEAKETTSKQKGIFTYSELENLCTWISMSYSAIAGDCEQACKEEGVRFTNSMAIECSIDADRPLTFGPIEGLRMKSKDLEEAKALWKKFCEQDYDFMELAARVTIFNFDSVQNINRDEFLLKYARPVNWRQHVPHGGMCDLRHPVCKAYIDHQNEVAGE